MLKLFSFLIVIFLAAEIPSFATTENSVSKEKEIKARFQKTVSKFESAIVILNPNLKKNERVRLAALISFYSKKYKLDPRIILSIISAESSFKQHAVSSTGDLGIAQINPKIWKTRMKLLTGKELDLKKLKHDEVYTLEQMCSILSFLKTKFAKEDKWWFARYHSSTHKHKSTYLTKLIREFKKIKKLGSNLLQDMPSIEDLKLINKSSTNIKLADNNEGLK